VLPACPGARAPSRNLRVFQCLLYSVHVGDTSALCGSLAREANQEEACARSKVWHGNLSGASIALPYMRQHPTFFPVPD
jgi:hypothetical protein